MSVTTSSCSSIEHCSNLETFLHSVTPVIKHASVPLTGTNEVQTNIGFKSAHTKLQDIWEIYDEWSCCGVGVPILLETGESIVQYYVPYLSAIQIFTSTGSNHDNDEDDNDNINLTNLGCSSYEDHLYVQFNESCSPYMRVPFLDKIIELAQNYPGLLTFDINDISPASWMSVAWLVLGGLETAKIDVAGKIRNRP
ncbi:uncharacterized protein LOC143546880 [Bidens hawaiensis]|uniref:uncharacterized protein LOC143546880 n=1 Tax=Bidens hawaiensis TaxID=980011 RepID=UPI00404B7D8D